MAKYDVTINPTLDPYLIELRDEAGYDDTKKYLKDFIEKRLKNRLEGKYIDEVVKSKTDAQKKSELS